MPEIGACFRQIAYWYTKNTGEPNFLAYDLLCRQKEVSPKVQEALLREIRNLPLQKNPFWRDEPMAAFRLSDLLQVIERHGWNTPEVLGVLCELKQRMGKMEVNSAKQLDQTLRKLQQLPGRYVFP